MKLFPLPTIESLLTDPYKEVKKIKKEMEKYKDPKKVMKELLSKELQGKIYLNPIFDALRYKYY